MENETTEMWREIRHERAAKRRDDRAENTQRLIDEGIPFASCNHGEHLKIGEWDFWPSSGKCRNRKTGKRMHGVHRLVYAYHNGSLTQSGATP